MGSARLQLQVLATDQLFLNSEPAASGVMRASAGLEQ